MRFECGSADIKFLESAPVQFRYVVNVNASLKQAFDALKAPETWPKWFPGMTSASAIQQGVEGPSRIVTLNHVIRFKEDFIVWEPYSRLAYRVSAVSIPYADRLVEEFSLKETDQGVAISYRIGMEVHRYLRPIDFLVSKIGERSYQKALIKLKNFLET